MGRTPSGVRTDLSLLIFVIDVVSLPRDTLNPLPRRDRPDSSFSGRKDKILYFELKRSASLYGPSTPGPVRTRWISRHRYPLECRPPTLPYFTQDRVLTGKEVRSTSRRIEDWWVPRRWRVRTLGHNSGSGWVQQRGNPLGRVGLDRDLRTKAR